MTERRPLTIPPGALRRLRVEAQGDLEAAARRCHAWSRAQAFCLGLASGCAPSTGALVWLAGVPAGMLVALAGVVALAAAGVCAQRAQQWRIEGRGWREVMQVEADRG